MRRTIAAGGLASAALIIPIIGVVASETVAPATAAAASPVAPGALAAAPVAATAAPQVRKKRKKRRARVVVSRADSPHRFGTVRYSKWYARQYMAKRYGWGPGKFRALVALWYHESNWQHRVGNASGAYGIPQALPGSKMRSAGADWRTNPETQIRWGLGYIKQRYGKPGRAFAHWRSSNWY